jgi:hypothetical protein
MRDETVPEASKAVVEHIPANRGVLVPMDMLSRAVESGASLDMVEKLMGLQERWEKNQARKAFDEAISAAKADIPPIERTGKGHNDKRYATFAAIATVVDPILSQHGLSYRFRTAQSERISVTCILSHKAGHYEETTLAGPPDASGSKNAIQAIGSTLTYLQRYSLIQMLGLAAADDDDGKTAAVEQYTPPEGSISAEQVANIRSALDAKNCSEKAFLQWAKQKRIESIPADLYDPCMDGIASFKKGGK